MKALIIARFCWLEAVRTRYLWLLIGTVLALLTLSFFLRAIAVTESDRIQVGVFAAFARIATVFLITLHVASSMVRQFNDRETDLLFALDLTRTDYLIGRFLGYTAVSLLSAAVVGAFLVLLRPEANVAAWSLSLAIELMLMSAVTLFFIVSFVQIAPAVLFVSAFYLLARSISAFQLISQSPLFSSGDTSILLGQKAVDLVALLLPRLDDFTQTAWLLSATAPGALANVLMQAGAYILLVMGAGLFDLHRKEL